MKAKALRDFNSLSLKKNFKTGDNIDESKELVSEWVKGGYAEEVKESKTAKNRKTK